MTATLVLNGIQLSTGSYLSSTLRDAIESGIYEALEAGRLPHIIAADERILEIGGGLGYISTLAAKIATQGTVTVVEADPRLIEVIAQNHVLNNVRCDVRHGVLTSNGSEKTTKFYIREDFWASSISASDQPYSQCVDVPVLNLESVLEEIKPTMLIVDIEGGERDFFSSSTFPGVKKILVELHPQLIGNEGVREIFQTLSAKGFYYDCYNSLYSVIHFLRFA